MLRSVADIGAVQGRRIIVRADLNAPVKDGAVADSYRLDAVLPTIELLLSKKARIILLSHMSDSAGTLRPVFEYLKTKISLTFVDDVAGAAT
ncbi:MAG: phosphoglycerate kinase, partial [Patescibacteria group bacterium]